MKNTIYGLLGLIWATSCVAPSLYAATPVTLAQFPPQSTTITFDTTPQGNSVPTGTFAGSIWASQGVVFDSNDFIGAPFTIVTPPNTLSGDNTSAFSSINATFTPAVKYVGAWGFDFVLEAFDASNQSLGSTSYTDGSPGLFGGANEYAFIGLQSDVPIAHVQFRRIFPTNQVFGYHIDNLTFSTVPEPSTLALAAFGCLGLVALHRRLKAES